MVCGSELRSAMSTKLYSTIVDQYAVRVKQLVSGMIRHENEIKKAHPFCFKNVEGVKNTPPELLQTQFSANFVR